MIKLDLHQRLRNVKIFSDKKSKIPKFKRKDFIIFLNNRLKYEHKILAQYW